MRPNLTLPQPTGIAAGIDPDRVQGWLNDISDADTKTCVTRISRATATLARSRTDTDSLLRALEHCRQAAMELGGGKPNPFAGLSLPLSSEAAALYAAADELYAELANGYKRIVAESDQVPRDERRPEFRNLVKACYWSTFFLGERLRNAYESYVMTAPGIWYEVHQIHEYARLLDIDRVLLKVGPDRTLARNLNHLYKRLLLLGLSDPYQLPYRTVARVYRDLDEWAAYAPMTRQPRATRRSCRFEVDPKLDRPATPLLRGISPRLEKDLWYLDTGPVLSKLRREHDRLATETAGNANPRRRAERFDRIEMLRSLIMKWGLRPIRRENRTPTHRGCQLVVGLKSIAYVLNGCQPVQVEPPDDSRAARASMIKGTFSNRRRPPTPVSVSRNWELTDESERGIRLLIHDGGTSHVRIGDLVAIQTSAQPQRWTVGSIRWAQTAGDGQLAVGVAKIGLDPEPVAVKRINTAEVGDTGPVALGLAFAGTDGPGHISLITDNGVYTPQGNVLIRTSVRDRVFTARNVLLSTRCFIWFELLSARLDTETTLELIQPFPRHVA